MTNEISKITFSDSGNTYDIKDAVARANYIPENTTYRIEVDGTGDFATFDDALEFLKGKVSGGLVHLLFGEGTHTLTKGYEIRDIEYGGIAALEICGVSKETTALKFVSSARISPCLNFYRLVNARLQNICIDATEIADPWVVVKANLGANLLIHEVHIKGGKYGIVSNDASSVRLSHYTFEGLSSNKAFTPLQAHTGADICIEGKYNISNANKWFELINGGNIVRISNVTKTTSNITNSSYYNGSSYVTSLNSITNGNLVIGYWT